MTNRGEYLRDEADELLVYLREKRGLSVQDGVMVMGFVLGAIIGEDEVAATVFHTFLDMVRKGEDPPIPN
jgi:hypothetical protein